MNVWSRLGLSVAVAAAFCIVVMEVFQDKTYYQLLKWYACASFAVGGVLFILLACGLRARVRRLTPISMGPSSSLPESAETPPELCVASHFMFWGPILLIFSATVFAIPYKEKEQEPVAARQTQVTPAPPPPVKEVPPPATFPEIKIQGLVYRPPRSAVIVNNKSFFVGDTYENAEIVSIEATNITLEVNGQRKTVPFDEALLRK